MRDAGDIAVGEMERQHLNQVLAIERASFKMPWSRSTFEIDLDSDLTISLVAVQGEIVVGYCVGWILPPYLHIGNLAVAERMRRRGIATTLLRRLLSAGEQGGARLATLEVRPSNEAALALYGRYGFRVVGRRPQYYVPDCEDAIVMARALGGGSAPGREGPGCAIPPMIEPQPFSAGRG